MEKSGNELKRGDIVEKIMDYPMLAEIRGVITTRAKETRYIVENLLAPGQLYILSREQIAPPMQYTGMTRESMILGYITNLIAQIVKQQPARKRKAGVIDNDKVRVERIPKERASQQGSMQFKDDLANAGYFTNEEDDDAD